MATLNFGRLSPIAWTSAFVLGLTCGSATAQLVDESVPDRMQIRLNLNEGHLIRYQLEIEGKTGWTPPIDEVDFGHMATQFVFTMRAKAKRPDGAWTFELLGEQLRSAGETSKGRLDAVLDRQQAKIAAAGKGSIQLPNSPLSKPMTMKLSPQGEYQFGTGLAPLAIFMLPHVDFRFWNLLTRSPDEPVEIGDEKEVDQDVPLPGTEGEPLRVRSKAKVLGWEKYRNRRVLAVGLAARLDLADTEILLKNGDRVRIARGQYDAEGKALWDVETGLLCSADARQEIQLRTEGRDARAFKSRNRTVLTMLKDKRGNGKE